MSVVAAGPEQVAGLPVAVTGPGDGPVGLADSEDSRAGARVERLDVTMRCTVTGPSCDTSDTLLQDADLPSSLKVGDRVYIGSASEYSLCYAAPFNGFPVPVPVYLD